MASLPPAVAAYDERAVEYDRWYDDNEALYRAELALVDELLAPLRGLGRGLEVGAGTGRFTGPLGIALGLEPSGQMGHRARAHGVDVIAGLAEDLPFADAAFGYTAFLTSLCFVTDRARALAQARRVTVDGGGIVVAFLDRASDRGKQLDATKQDDPYYATARLFTPGELAALLESAGYVVEEWRQLISAADGAPTVSVGTGTGLYCAVRARLR